MGMRRIMLVPVLVVVATLAACGGSIPEPPAGSSPADEPTITYDPDPERAVVDVTQPLGGFVPAEVAIDTRPQFRLYGDGVVIALPAEHKLGGFPELVTYTLSDDGIGWVLGQADAEGLIAPPPDYGQPPVTDVGTVTTTIRANDGEFAHSVYGPGFENEEAAGLEPAQVEARQALAGFVDAVVALPTDHPELLVASPTPYDPAAVAVWAFELPADADVPSEPWPLATPLADLPADTVSGNRCTVVTGADIATLHEAFAGTTLGTAWSSGSLPDGEPRLWSVGLNPVLPGDAGCPAAAG